MGIVHKSQGRLSPASNKLKSESWIVAELATKYYARFAYRFSQIRVQNYDDIRALRYLDCVSGLKTIIKR